MLKLAAVGFLSGCSFAQFVQGGAGIRGGSGVRAYSSTPSNNCGAYSRCYAITSDHTKVPNTDQINFPFPVRGLAATKTAGNSGFAMNASGYDVNFFPGTACSGTKLSWETDTYSASTIGSLWWVKVPTLSHTTDTLVGYMCIGNSAVTTDQSTPSAVWDSNTLCALHFGATSLSLTDSTANGYAAFNNNGVVGGTGYLGGESAVYGASTDYLQIANGCTVTSNNPRTISFWVKATNTGNSDNVFYDTTSGPNAGRWLIDPLSTTSIVAPGTVWATAFFTGNALDSQWHSVVSVLPGSDLTSVKFYLDGNPLSLTLSGGGSNYTVNTVAGAFLGSHFDGHSVGTVGSFDEFREESVARSADWIATRFNCESGTCYTAVQQ